jgi:hypothetical protein
MSLFPTLTEYFMYSHLPYFLYIVVIRAVLTVGRKPRVVIRAVLTVGRKPRVDWIFLRTYSLQNYFSKL